MSVTITASNAKTAGVAGPDETVQRSNIAGVIVYFTISNIVTTGGLALFLEGYDPIGATYYTIYQSPNYTTVGARAIALGKNVSAANLTAAATVNLPERWRVRIGTVDANTMTWYAGYDYLY